MAFYEKRTIRVTLTAIALAAVTVGAYFPWVRPNPDLAGTGDAIPDILLPKMNAGIEGYSLLLLVLILVMLVLVARGGSDRFQSVTAFTVGIFAISIPVYYIYSTSLAGFDSTFVPAYGWYITIGGGILLVVVGLIQLLSTEPANETTAKKSIKS